MRKIHRNAFEGNDLNAALSGDYQVVVTYRDGGGLWRDRTMSATDITVGEMIHDERDVRCIVTPFWIGAAHAQRIQHVEMNAKGQVFRMPWTSDLNQATPPTLNMRMRLHYTPDMALKSVTWQERDGAAEAIGARV